MGKAKKMDAIKKSWMKDLNHKISRQIVHFAVTNGVGLIRLEDLTGIRYTVKYQKKKPGGHIINSENSSRITLKSLVLIVRFFGYLSPVYDVFRDIKLFTSVKVVN